MITLPWRYGCDLPPLMPAHIKNCARCGHDHPGLLFRQLKRVGQAPGSEWSHWASCPETGSRSCSLSWTTRNGNLASRHFSETIP